MIRYTSIVLFVLIASATAGCGHREHPVQFDPVKEPFERLTDYHFFRGEPAGLQPNDRVLPFDVNSPLFSDYAEKLRFVWMPEGTSADYNDSTFFPLPIGTVLIKNFYYPQNFRNKTGPRRILETRLLVHRPDGWKGLPYIWNDHQTEAYLRLAGGEKPVRFIQPTGKPVDVNYLIPNVNQCRSCHNTNDKMVPLGVTARQLNRDYVYEDGVENQLIRWEKSGYLNDVPDPSLAPRLPDYRDPSTGTVQMRARAYLHANCMHCHNRAGPANISGLFLSFDEENPTALGIMKPPVAAGRGSGGKAFSVVPGKPEESILIYRMESTEPGSMMPEIGRTLIDEHAVELIREWIKEMPTVGY